MKKKILFILIFFSSAVFLFAQGAKSTTAEQTSSAGLTSRQASSSEYKNLRWIYVNKNTGEMTTVKAQAGEAQPTDAAGYIYDSDTEKDKVVYTSEEESYLAGWLTTLSNTLNNICFRFILAIHPFPNILFQMYDTSSFTEINAAISALSYTMESKEGVTGSYSSDYLLISNNFYNPSILANDKADNDRWTVSIAESPSATSGVLTKQYSKWSLVTVLFVTMFIAEMLFMSIWGYVTGSTENVLKEIAKKAGITFALFVLVAALPFLLESMRYGFFKIADVFYGQVAKSYAVGAGYSRYFNNPAEIFNLPGAFAEQMIPFFSTCTVENGTQALGTMMGELEEKSYNYFQKLLMVAIMFVFRFVMFFAILKASLHIAVNTIEVYLLLGLTMILVPFSVFEPVKPIGSKCIMSLVSNLIECFVILVIVVCVVPATVTVCQEILEDIKGYQNEEILFSEADVMKLDVKGDVDEQVGFCQIVAHPEFTMLVVPTSSYDANEKTIHVGLIIGPTDFQTGNISAAIKNYADANGIDYLFDVKNKNGTSFSKFTPVYTSTSDGVLAYKYEHIRQSDDFSTRYLDSLKDDFIVKVNNLNTAGVFFNTDLESRTRFIESLVSYFADSTSLNNYITRTGADYYSKHVGVIAAITGAFSYTKENASFSPPMSYTGSVVKDSTSALTFVGQLLLCFMGMYIPVFFVQQSTQITNSLLNGTAAMESFANTLGNMARSTVNTLKTAVMAPVKAVGSISRMYNEKELRDKKKSQEKPDSKDPTGAERINR